MGERHDDKRRPSGDPHDDRGKQDSARDLDAIKKVVDRTAGEVHAQTHTLTKMAAALEAMKTKLDTLTPPPGGTVNTGRLKPATDDAKAKRAALKKVVDENKT